MSIIQFKAIRRIPDHHKTIPGIPLPPLMAKHHQNVELAMDFLFVNRSPFLNKKSSKIDFSSVQECNNRGKSETISVLNQVKTKYKDKGFTITYYYGENEFDYLHNFLAPSHLHTCAVNTFQSYHALCYNTS